MCQSTSLELKQFHYMMLKWEWKVKWKCSSLVSDSSRPHELQPTRLLCLWNSPGKNTGVDCHSLLQGIFPTQGSNPRLLHCRQILYSLSHLGSHLIVSKALSNWTPDSLSRNFMFTVQQEHSGLFQFTELANCLFSLRAFELIKFSFCLFTPPTSPSLRS